MAGQVTRGEPINTEDGFPILDDRWPNHFDGELHGKPSGALLTFGGVTRWRGG